MTIYWERCDICGRHHPTKTCWLHPELSICAHCCLMCPERSICPNPAWFPELKLEAVKLHVERRPTTPAASLSREEKRRKLEELLKKLSGQ